MKHAKNLTRSMKRRLTALKLNPDNWQYIKNTPEGLVLVNKKTGSIQTI